MARLLLTERQQAVMQEAQALLAQHGLIQRGWRFAFDHAKRRAGQCRYHLKTITVSRSFAEAAPSAEVTDTLLHEIAHALLPPGTGHSALWKQTAQAIGCTARRCHTLYFAAPKYVQSCSQGCWRREVHRRRRGLICRLCKAKVIYSPYLALSS